MVAIPKPKTTKEILNSRTYESKPSRRLGLSSIGKECYRALWYSFHWVSKREIKARTQRIFTIGNIFEEMIISDLESIGIMCYRKENNNEQVTIIKITGKIDEQQEEIIGFAGHAVGRIDGRGTGFLEYPNQELLLEFKTMADKQFSLLIKEGVKKSQPVYYAQCQRYLHGVQLEVCCFIAINKNDCSYHFEFIEYDKNYALDLVRKEQEIIISDHPPDKHYAVGHYQCNMCDHNAVCHLGDEIEKTCRTCCHVDLDIGGNWICTNRKKFSQDHILTYDEQLLGCKYYKVGWGIGFF